MANTTQLMLNMIKQAKEDYDNAIEEANNVLNNQLRNAKTQRQKHEVIINFYNAKKKAVAEFNKHIHSLGNMS